MVRLTWNSQNLTMSSLILTLRYIFVSCWKKKEFCPDFCWSCVILTSNHLQQHRKYYPTFHIANTAISSQNWVLRFQLIFFRLRWNLPAYAGNLIKNMRFISAVISAAKEADAIRGNMSLARLKKNQSIFEVYQET